MYFASRAGFYVWNVHTIAGKLTTTFTTGHTRARELSLERWDVRPLFHRKGTLVPSRYTVSLWLDRLTRAVSPVRACVHTYLERLNSLYYVCAYGDAGSKYTHRIRTLDTQRRRNENSWIKGSLARHVPRGLTSGFTGPENPDGMAHLFCPPVRSVCALLSGCAPVGTGVRLTRLLVSPRARSRAVVVARPRDAVPFCLSFSTAHILSSLWPCSATESERTGSGGGRRTTWKAVEKGSGEIDRWIRKERMDKWSRTPAEYRVVIERIKLRSMIIRALGFHRPSETFQRNDKGWRGSNGLGIINLLLHRGSFRVALITL